MHDTKYRYMIKDFISSLKNHKDINKYVYVCVLSMLMMKKHYNIITTGKCIYIIGKIELQFFKLRGY